MKLEQSSAELNVPDQLVAEPVRQAVSGISKSEAWRQIKVGRFPAPVRIGSGRCTRWSLRELNEWVRARLSERDQAAA